eukprot:2283405-Rhodomonas_salina.3
MHRTHRTQIASGTREGGREGGRKGGSRVGGKKEGKGGGERRRDGQRCEPFGFECPFAVLHLAGPESSNPTSALDFAKANAEDGRDATSAASSCCCSHLKEDKDDEKGGRRGRGQHQHSLLTAARFMAEGRRTHKSSLLSTYTPAVRRPELTSRMVATMQFLVPCGHNQCARNLSSIRPATLLSSNTHPA